MRPYAPSSSSSAFASSSSSSSSSSRPTLAEFRRSEGPILRAAKLQALWRSLPCLPEPSTSPTPTSLMHLPGQGTIGIMSPERVERLKRLYEEELSRRISLEDREEARLWGGADDLPDPSASTHGSMAPNGGAIGNGNGTGRINESRDCENGKGIKWKDFRKFLWDQEEELWDVFCDLDKDGDGKLETRELKSALARNGMSHDSSGSSRCDISLPTKSSLLVPVTLIY